MEIYLLDFAGIVVKCSQKPVFFTFLERLHNVFSIFFSRWLLVNNSRNKRVSVVLLYLIGFETINLYIFFIKMSCFGSNFFFKKNKELLIITKNADTLLYSSVSWNSVQNFKVNGQGVLVLALGEHDMSTYDFHLFRF